MTNANDEAFGHGADNGHCPGLTKREYFAGLAMQGLLASDGKRECEEDTVASWSVQQADALIAELNKEASE